MTTQEEYELLDSIPVPPRFNKRSSYWIWFSSGVLAGLSERAPQEATELKQRHSAEIAAAYQAGFAAGRAKRAEGEANVHQVPVPERYGGSLMEKIWFLKGVDEALAGRPYETPSDLPRRRSMELLRAYRAGYLTGERQVG
jgi:hypothetical protein